jgi:PAS domain S-box-containing protein
MNPDHPSEPRHLCRSGAPAAIRCEGGKPDDHVTAGDLSLTLSEQRRAIDNAVIVVESDTSGVITYVNDKFCEISGYGREEVIGRDHRFLNSGHHPRTFFDGMWATLRRGEVWQDEICNRSKSGSMFWLLTRPTTRYFQPISTARW